MFFVPFYYILAAYNNMEMMDRASSFENKDDVSYLGGQRETVKTKPEA